MKVYDKPNGSYRGAVLNLKKRIESGEVKRDGDEIRDRDRISKRELKAPSQSRILRRDRLLGISKRELKVDVGLKGSGATPLSRISKRELKDWI